MERIRQPFVWRRNSGECEREETDRKAKEEEGRRASEARWRTEVKGKGKGGGR